MDVLKPFSKLSLLNQTLAFIKKIGKWPFSDLKWIFSALKLILTSKLVLLSLVPTRNIILLSATQDCQKIMGGDGWWWDMERKCPIVWDRVNWYVKILGCLSANSTPNNPPNPGSDGPCTFKLSPGLHKKRPIIPAFKRKNFGPNKWVLHSPE